MILAKGKIYPSSEQDSILENLEQEINETLSEASLNRETVISAIDTLGQKIAKGEFNDIISEFLTENIDYYINLVTEFMSRKSLEFRIATELGSDFKECLETIPPYGIKKASVRFVPLGNLFHIAAGNMDGLPAFSVIEGLLTGNINILKLPQADNGLTIEIFRQLIETEPSLASYIYVFDTPSTDVIAMQKMAQMADGIVVWGGDEAVKAVRTLAPVGAQIIEWGHKLGFAYISGYHDKSAELSALAKHIIDTRQLLCSSCQTIYIDTEDMEEVYAFCRDFLPYLETAAKENPIREIGAVAEISLRRYSSRLEEILESDHVGVRGDERGNECCDGQVTQKVFQGKHCSVTACTDSELELSYMYGNVLVKRLPQREIVRVLRKSKGYLQTAGLICSPEKREQLTDILIRSGVNRVMTAGNMSVTFCGEAHDGTYPLRRYMRVVNVEA